ncbi:MAG: DUF3332 domain-containing protein [Bacteroidales bacterium]|nr:DUF3332 domain-containing protein [Bacteroidales bacterium]
MKKFIIPVAIAALMCSSLSSCMGQFALTKNLYAWNGQISNKFVNELVFVAFWVLPVYEVCGLADLLVLNSIEFWSGDNPMTASTKVIDSDQGRYLVKCDGKGYDVTLEATGESYRLDFAQESQTWSLQFDGKEYPLMTFIDDSHVAMPAADGQWQTVELSQDGVLAYRNVAAPAMMALK